MRGRAVKAGWGDGRGITQVCGFEVITQCVIKILIALGLLSVSQVPKQFW